MTSRWRLAAKSRYDLLGVAGELSPLEREVIATILAPDHPVMEALRRQFARCHVASRQITGVGFVIDLAVPADVKAAPVKAGRIDLGDVTATIAGLEHGAGFVLFVRDGVLEGLEGFSYDEPWPDVTARHEVTAGGVMYGGGSKTDIEEVDAAWDRPRDIHGH
jgi:hypothetical protein